MKVRRGTRWVIGILVTVVLALVSLIALAVAAFVGFVQGIDFDETDELTGRAQATVLDVDREGGDRQAWVTADVQFRANGGERVVTTIDWAFSSQAPAVGDVIEVAFDPVDPERAEDASHIGPPGSGVRVMPDSDAGTGYVVAAVSGGLALAALVGTVVWATRAPKPEVRSRYPHAYPPPPRYPVPPPHAYPMPPPGYPVPPEPPRPPATWPRP